MEQVREIDGEQAYEKMRRAVEKASQVEKEIQVERASQPVRHSQFPSRKRPKRGGPERGLWPQPLGFSQGRTPPLASACFCFLGVPSS